MDAGRMLRAARRARRLSQRELAAEAGVPRSTIDRIESGRTDPRLSTLRAIAEAVRLEVVLIDPFGAVVDVDVDGDDRLFDRVYRRLPAHLPKYPVRGEGDGWWGWRRIAWRPDDPAVPPVTYALRPRPGSAWCGVRAAAQWNDAT